VLGLRVRISSGAWLFVLCVVNKDKTQDKQEKKQERMKCKEYKRIQEENLEGGKKLIFFPKTSVPAVGPTQPPMNV
jgi:hypothetical protein